MSKNENSVRQPYEIIETLEETITRYFNPNLREKTFNPNDHTSVNIKQ